jgi:hypothetical protein
MVEAYAKATVVRESIPNYQALEGKENGRDQRLQSSEKGSLTIRL